jgi:hypothetical protein
MEEIMKTMDKITKIMNSALASVQLANLALMAKEQRIQELELERATLLVVLQRLRDGRAEGLKQ